MYFYSTLRYEKSIPNAGLPQRLVQDCVDPVSKQLNIFKRVKSPQWLLLHKECLKQKNTAWSRKAPCGHVLICRDLQYISALYVGICQLHRALAGELDDKWHH